MTLPSRTAGAVALIAGLGVALPGTALAQRGEHGHGAKVPARIATKLRSADRALERAQDKADDGDAAGAATSLAAVRRNLASATTSATKRAGGTTGPASVGAVSAEDDQVVEGAAALLDGAGEELTSAAASTLDAALDGRDALVAAVAALPAEDQAAYARILSRIDDAVAGEVEDLTEARSDDELTDAGKAAIDAALTQLAATNAAVDALAASGEDGTSDVADYPGGTGTTGATGARGDCPGGGRGDRQRPGSSTTAPATDDDAVTPGQYS